MDKRKEERWKKLLAEWSASGLRREEFCKSKGVSVWALGYWRRKIGKGKNGSGTGFVRVSTQPRVSGRGIRIHFGSQAVVEIEGAVDEEELAKVLRAVKAVV